MRCSERAAALFATLLAACACAASTTAQSTPPAHLDTTVASLHTGQVVDSVPCLADELPMNHTHVHLAVFWNGTNVTVPAGIGVGRPWGVDSDGFIGTGSCFAWIHTHDTTGVVHVFSPDGKTYTLAQLFAVWGHGLGADRAFNVAENVAVLVNGARVTGNPGDVQLGNYFNVVIELGRAPAAAPPSNYDFGSTRR